MTNSKSKFMMMTALTSMLTQGLVLQNTPKNRFLRLKVKEIGVPVSGIPHKGHKPFEFTDGTIIYALNQTNAQKKYDKLANGRR